jgi:long-chain acyl-CoA synthetase
MLSELAAALEKAGVPAGAVDGLHQVQTVAELSRAVAGATRRGEGDARPEGAPAEADEPRDVVVPGPLADLGRRILGVGQRFLYQDVYDTAVRGTALIPRDRNFLVVANHASHLDMGLVKVALGDQGGKLCALAARDYFFDTPLKRAYFENFTNLIPMERSGSLRRSLRGAVEAVRRGMNLLIFPEGTRSRDGGMAPFKPTAGYLALTCGVDTLPVYIRGTHDALPPGHALPRRAKLEVVIGKPIGIEEVRRRTEHLAKGEAHKEATRIMEEAVRRLGEVGTTPSPRPAPSAREGEKGPTTAAAAATGTSNATAPSPLPAPAREREMPTPVLASPNRQDHE